ncbi:protein of unknown function, partial [Belliella buryatensis]
MKSKLALVILLNLIFLHFSLGQNVIPNNWKPNNRIFNISEDDRYVYIVGLFSELGGEKIGGVAKFSRTSDDLDINFPVFTKDDNESDATIHIIVSDGEDGWFIGGDFSKVNNISKGTIVHILSDGSVDPNWNVSIANGGSATSVSSIIVTEDHVFIAGNFIEINGFTKNRIAKLNKSNGQLDNSFGATFNQAVSSIILDDEDLYVSGTFTTVNSITRNRLAKINASTGDLDENWNPSASATVNNIYLKGDHIYVAGSFTEINGISKSRIARLNKSKGEVDMSFDAAISGEVRSLDFSPDNSTIYLAGSFTSVGGVQVNGIARLNNSGQVDSNWIPKVTGPINTLNLKDNSLYVGGSFSAIDGISVSGIARLSVSDGKISKDWNKNVAIVNTIFINQNSLMLGGRFSRAGMALRRSLARFYKSDFSLDLEWRPNEVSISSSTSEFTNLIVVDEKIYIAGSFRVSPNSMTRGLAELDYISGKVIQIYQTPEIRSIVAFDNHFYAAGNNEQKIIKIDRSSGVIENSGEISLNGPAQILKLSDDNLYIGGSFTEVAGVNRSKIAKYNLTTNSLDLSWNAGLANSNANTVVQSIAIDDDAVFIGGRSLYADINDWRPFFKLDKNAGQIISSWNPSPTGSLGLDGAVISPPSIVSSSDNYIYLVAPFFQFGGVNRPRLARVNKSIGGLDSSWNPNPNGSITSILVSENNVFIGGYFTTLLQNNISEKHFALFSDPVPPSAPTILSSVLNKRNATISFVQGSNGNSPIINYEYKLNDSEWILFDPEIQSSPGLITKLAYNTNYTIQIRAINEIGIGNPSNIFEFTTGAPPSLQEILSDIVNNNGANTDRLDFNDLLGLDDISEEESDKLKALILEGAEVETISDLRELLDQIRKLEEILTDIRDNGGANTDETDFNELLGLTDITEEESDKLKDLISEGAEVETVSDLRVLLDQIRNQGK